MVRVEVLTDRPEDRFAPGRTLYREGSTAALTIVASGPVEDGPGWRLHFREVTSRTAAERLREAWLETEVDRTADLEPGAAYWHEVVGSEVRGLNGSVLGTVADVYRVGEAEVVVVRGGPAGEFDVPIVKDIVRTFAPERREIVVDEAILDLGSLPVDARPAAPPRKRPRWSRHGKGGSPGPSESPASSESPGSSPPTAGPAEGS
ncbi:MAG: ribosome maturation factor RimM [Chloroflexi bacterium]|nr:ribosome maturation factor RimM [Chloroflexota bacterium]